MLKIIPRDRIKVLVEGKIPTDMGGTKKFDFVATWKVLTSSEHQKILNDLYSDWIFKDYLLDVEGITDADDNPVEFSPEMAETLYQYIPVREALIRSLVACQSVEAREELRRKN